MKYFKSNDSENELTLLKLKILTSVKNDTCNTDESDEETEDENIDYNLEFDVESVKGITMIEVDKKGT
jgi:hypothetical protein